MEHRLLDYFLVLAEELHFTKAADRLGITQPTLSHQIKLLEQELGTPLFQRSGKKTYLTSAGSILMEHAQQVHHELTQARLKIGELSGLKRGRLRIGCSGNHLLTESLISFHQLHPDIELTVMELATDETHEGLLTNRLDLGVVFLPLEDEQLMSRPLFNEELVFIISKHHKLASIPQITLPELRDVPLILFQQKFLARQLLDQACRQAGIALRPVIELSTMDSQIRMAEQGIGATILPASYAAITRSTGLAIIPLAPSAPRKEVGLVYKKSTFLDPALNQFILHLEARYLQGK
ncbi:LysR family transcriptional regulator [Paenibacillus brevis]|uniref:LysR family transcriptional regulator n=1 Tax=Paenibacillus brevis TaxID=2841508 RepID=A0ABS6FR74_9BACL|nr:LysR substrate-binding domain-containing protein [Paenibacillus brevis]MBU5672431.1 LysR family transcriptional regulator [Paenibacillus brevis]